MSNSNLNKVTALGNNIFIFQYINSEGEQIEERKSFQEFLQPFIDPYQEQIKILKSRIKDKVKIQGYLDKEIIGLSNKIEALKNEKKSLENQVSHFLTEIEGKDLSENTNLYQEALDYFIVGKMDKALVVLDEVKMEEEEKLAIEDIKQKAETRILKARILRVKNKFAEAGSNYEKALELFSNWDNCLEAANYFKFIHKFNKSTHYYRICLQKVTSNYEKAATLNNLANLQSDKNEFGKAESSYLEALEIRRKLAEDNPQTYLPDVGMTLNNLAVLQRDKNEFEKAESSYEEALEIYRKLAEANPQTYLPYVAGTLNNLAVLQRAKNEFEKAESSYEEALEIRRKLAEANPQTYLPDVGMTQINMGIYYQESKIDRALSIQLVDEAITNLLPFYQIPYIQNYLKVAFKVLKGWEIDIETYLEKKMATNNEQNGNMG
ncbi:tetratricopeptide repeat protein [Flavivirga aquimarina]|uniref:Tetratricopeptide repeat protein n=1 Tax=Flavivirga aquimarina TaxID=2027862 RepID=A0ABT8W8A1_9FLAO|nr:tetratricopeptide repeat protein [Flavivirga aquimarina]MDO5969355.1 tetratricopeptide repeat protein [Flavivirga aquimarina]